ncbi:hypothetical protein [Allofustis seminis]|uniref:hypothetical protein n=1 Tax=Allofustis seminis TaxID=166939 RepID=UPI000365D846|nr:hypothetical protein [Allofustis seminis]
MSQTATFSILGSSKKFQLHSNIKRYSLRDHGFMETKNGNFQYERPLSTVITDSKAPVLKMTISKNFDRVRLSIVASVNSAKKINIYKNEHMEDARELLEFILKEFIEAEIIQEMN